MLNQYFLNLLEESKTPLIKGETVCLVWDDDKHFKEWYRSQSATPEEKKSNPVTDMFLLRVKSNTFPLDLKTLNTGFDGNKDDVGIIVGATADGDVTKITGLKVFFCTVVSEDKLQTENK